MELGVDDASMALQAQAEAMELDETPRVGALQLATTPGVEAHDHPQQQQQPQQQLPPPPPLPQSVPHQQATGGKDRIHSH